MLRNKIARTALRYSVITIFCALFGAVYEIFSHGVYSYYMIYAFAFPLILGVLPHMILVARGKDDASRPSSVLYHFGIAILTTGSLAQGVIEIYGTYNSLIQIYWIAGVICICVSVILHLISLARSAKSSSNQS